MTFLGFSKIYGTSEKKSEHTLLIDILVSNTVELHHRAIMTMLSIGQFICFSTAGIGIFLFSNQGLSSGKGLMKFRTLDESSGQLKGILRSVAITEIRLKFLYPGFIMCPIARYGNWIPYRKVWDFCCLYGPKLSNLNNQLLECGSPKVNFNLYQSQPSCLSVAIVQYG